VEAGFLDRPARIRERLRREGCGLRQRRLDVVVAAAGHRRDIAQRVDRAERRHTVAQGESIGGTLINLCFAELLSIGGFFISEALFHPPLAFQLIFWVTFNILFVLLFYRHARGMWVAIGYLSGGVYPDPDDASDWKREQ
jgi:hypothetical protein